MSVYLQRLVQRAIPAPPSVRGSIPEIKPSVPMYRSAQDDQMADIEIETELPVQPPEALPPAKSLAQATQPSLVMPGAHPLNDFANSQPAAIETSGAKATPQPVQTQQAQQVNAAAQAYEPFLNPYPAPTQRHIPAKKNDGQQSATEIRPRVQPDAGEPVIVRSEISPRPEIQPNEMETQRRQPAQAGPAPMIAPLPESLPDIFKQNTIDEGKDPPRLEPQVSALPDFNRAATEPDRLTIGSLTVEVLPPAPPAAPIQQTVQVTQPLQARPPRQGRSSKLKFGLGQM